MSSYSAINSDTGSTENEQLTTEPYVNQSTTTDGPKNTLDEPVLPKAAVSNRDPYQERQYQKGRLALAFRIFAKLYNSSFPLLGTRTEADKALQGDPVEPTSFWVNPFGLAWPRLRASDLIRVDKSGAVVDGGKYRRLNTAAYMIHHAIHVARPEVNCVAHSHSIYGRAFCALGRNLDLITQDSCAFHNDIALYQQFKGVVLAQEEGHSIVTALGKKKAALLQNHGLLTCGESIESTVFWFMSLEKCCHVQLMADAAAAGRASATVKIPDSDAEHTYKTVGTEDAGLFSALPTFDMMEEDSGTDYQS
ncbi:hypothetical protein V502_02381 [Pseudogymnoascus sp. VKM F-4520 (FW-2644)]|nr:hypothetical protein V502_02381 [Pseudogymnoascus sp. VKM F-4520 (FW-2644)]